MTFPLIITDEAGRQKVNQFYDVPGYEDYYEINAAGVVWSKPRHVNSPICGGRRLRPAKRMSIFLTAGYPAFSVSKNGKDRPMPLHRVLAMIFIPNPDNKPEINHIDGDRANFALSNLEWCTHKENMRHAHRTGLIPPSQIGPGERSHAAKLNDEKVREIKRRLLSGETQISIAHDYGVVQGTIGFIASGETWSHIRIEGAP